MNTVGKKVVSGLLSACVAFPIGAALLTNSVQVNAAEISSRFESYSNLTSFAEGDIINKGTTFSFSTARYSSFTLKIDGAVAATASDGAAINYTFTSDVMITSANNVGYYGTAAVLSCQTVERAVCEPLTVEPEDEDTDDELPDIQIVCEPLFFEDTDPEEESDMWMVDDPLFFEMPEVDEGTIDVAAVAAPVTESSRILTIRHFVDSLYVDALGRNGTNAERNQWVDMILGQNVTGDEAVETFLNSSEFINRNLDDEEFIAVINNIFFGGEMSAEAQADILDQLDLGTERAAIVEQMIDTEAWASVCASNQVVHETKAS